MTWVAQWLAADPLSTDLLLQYGVIGLVLAAVMTGLLYTRPAFKAMEADRDEWKASSLKKDDVIAALIKTVEEQGRANATTVETGKLAVAILDGLGHVRAGGGTPGP